MTSADQSDAAAQFLLGVEYANDAGTKHDYASALRCYLKAAEQNHIRAQLFLGVLYARGRGIPRDGATAVLWFQKAAQRGYTAAQYHLGIEIHRRSFDESPTLAKESLIEAYKWLGLAMTEQYPDAQAAYERVVMRMTHEDVAEGNRRIAAFSIPT